MIKQVGSEGMIFFTFSSADLHWPELHDLMPPITEGEMDSVGFRRLVVSVRMVASGKCSCTRHWKDTKWTYN